AERAIGSLRLPEPGRSEAWRLATIASVICAAIGYLILKRFPNSGDEYAYLLQSEFFASGTLAGQGFPPEVRHLFELDHVINGDRLVAKYPPGWPALLAVGGLLGQPWLVPPLCAGLSVWAVYRLTLD